jgi:hypothetical protein
MSRKEVLLNLKVGYAYTIGLSRGALLASNRGAVTTGKTFFPENPKGDCEILLWCLVNVQPCEYHEYLVTLARQRSN